MAALAAERRDSLVASPSGYSMATSGTGSGANGRRGSQVDAKSMAAASSIAADRERRSSSSWRYSLRSNSPSTASEQPTGSKRRRQSSRSSSRERLAPGGPESPTSRGSDAPLAAAEQGSTSSDGGSRKIQRQDTSDWSRPRSRSGLDDYAAVAAVAAVSASRSAVSHSRTPSMEDEEADPRAATDAHSDRGPSASSRPGNTENVRESNYTWQSEHHSPAPAAMSVGAMSDQTRSPGRVDRSRILPSIAGMRGMPAPAGPSSQQHGLYASQSGHQGARSRHSPSPRLPSFASLQPRDNSASPYGNTSVDSQHRRHAEYVQQQQQPQQQQRMPEQSLLSSSQDRPRVMSGLSAMTYASSHSGTGSSPPFVQSAIPQSQATIHHSLAGLPGSGGGPGSKQQPSFVSKLYSMLEDDSIQDMIWWSADGDVFSVANPSEFSRLVLPLWFKHSNWQSFVRQLNMYDFHKVNSGFTGTGPDEIAVWQFKHNHFRRGEVHLLADIKRKSSRHKRGNSPSRSAQGGGEHGSQARSIDSVTPPPDTPNMSASYPSYSGNENQYAAGPSNTRPTAALHREYSRGDPRDEGPPLAAAHRAMYEAEPAAVAGPSSAAGAVAASRHERVAMDPAEAYDQSERIDALIRHANYLEAQQRAQAEQIHHGEQVEANLLRHIGHLDNHVAQLDSQLRHVMDQLARFTGAGAGSATPQQQQHERSPTMHAQQPSMRPPLARTISGSSGYTRSSTMPGHVPNQRSPLSTRAALPPLGPPPSSSSAGPAPHERSPYRTHQQPSSRPSPETRFSTPR